MTVSAYTFHNFLDGHQSVRGNELVLSTPLYNVRCPKAEIAWVCISGVIRAKPGTGAKFDVLPTHRNNRYTVVRIKRADGREFTYRRVAESPLAIAAQFDALGYTVIPCTGKTGWLWS
jgi:hypothetical protein